MTISEPRSKFKIVGERLRESAPLLLILVLVGFAAFGLGRISAKQTSRETVTVYGSNGAPIEQSPVAPQASREAISGVSEQAAAIESGVTTGEVVGSKNSTKYHLPWCSGAKRISETNKIVFKTVAEAEAAGYTPAANCPGI